MPTVFDLLQAGESVASIAHALGMSESTVRRIIERGPDYQPKKPTGRPAQVEVTPEEALTLSRAYVRSNRGRGQGSKTLAARWAAKRGDLSPELQAAILKPRASKHSLPAPVKRAMDLPPALIEQHRSPGRVALSLGDVPGQMRMALCGTRRLWAGERQSWDDATINFAVTVPWPWGGCKCSDRYGVRVGRFQLLAGIDDATDFCPGFSYVIRTAGSYRGTDITAACARVWRDDVLPASVIFERGVWESNHVEAFLRGVGIAAQRAYRPTQKLVESYWNRAWSVLSVETDGQVGRFRGEHEEETKLLMSAQAGRHDPRQSFPDLGAAMSAIERAVRYLNADPVESKHYGRWIPAERYEADLAEHPRPALSADLAWAWAPERKVWTVRKGIVGGKVMSPFGVSFPYHFASPDLWEYEGARVAVHFDPWNAPIRAAILLEENCNGRKRGELLTAEAECLSDAPRISEVDGDWIADRSEGGLQRALEIRKAYLAAVRTEYRALGLRGQQKAAESEVTTAQGRASARIVSDDDADGGRISPRESNLVHERPQAWTESDLAAREREAELYLADKDPLL